MVLAEVVPDPRQRPTLAVQPDGFLNLHIGQPARPAWYTVGVEQPLDDSLAKAIDSLQSLGGAAGLVIRHQPGESLIVHQ